MGLGSLHNPADSPPPSSHTSCRRQWDSQHKQLQRRAQAHHCKVSEHSMNQSRMTHLGQWGLLNHNRLHAPRLLLRTSRHHHVFAPPKQGLCHMVGLTPCVQQALFHLFSTQVPQSINTTRMSNAVPICEQQTLFQAKYKCAWSWWQLPAKHEGAMWGAVSLSWQWKVFHLHCCERNYFRWEATQPAFLSSMALSSSWLVGKRRI